MRDPTDGVRFASKSNAALRHDAETAERFALEALDLAALTDVAIGGELQHYRAERACLASAQAHREAGNHTRAELLERKASESTDRARFVQAERRRFLEAFALLGIELRKAASATEASKDAAIFWASHLKNSSDQNAAFRWTMGIVFVVVLLLAVVSR